MPCSQIYCNGIGGTYEKLKLKIDIIMAKRDDFYGLEIKVVYEQHSVCAYEDGDETFHTIHHEADGDFGGVALKYKEAYIKVTKLTPAEGKLRAEFYELKKAQNEAFNALKEAFYPFSKIEEPKIERSRIEFIPEEETIGELNLTKEEYDFTLGLNKYFSFGRNKFVITGNGKNFLGVVTPKEHFEWAQLRSSYNPREICSSNYIDGMDRKIYEFFKDFFLSILEELL